MRGCIVRRGESYAVKVYLGRDASGKERQKWASFPTRREAERHLAALVAQVQSGGTLPSTRLRLGEFLESWLRDYVEGACGPVTLAGYRLIIRQHLIPALGHIPLARLGAQALQGYYSAKLGQGLSATTVLHHHRLLHEALHHAVRWGVTARNPAELVDPPRAVRREMRVLDEEQVRLFLAEAKRSSAHYPLYLAALTTGMREGELLGLRWRDVDLLLGTVTVEQTLYRLGGRVLFKSPKTHRSARSVVLLPVLTEELRRLRERQDAVTRNAGPAYEDHGLVFCQPTGKPLHAHNLSQRDFHAVGRHAKVPRVRFHDLRHCHATLLLQQGVHPKVVSERLGHSKIGVTLDLYTHVLPGMQEQAAQELEERLFRAPAAAVF